MSEPKPVEISNHARDQMNLRGATEEEVVETIRAESWTQAKRGRRQARHRFAFGKLSPINKKEYKFKDVEPIFTEESGAIVVVTVKVYYTNEEQTP